MARVTAQPSVDAPRRILLIEDDEELAAMLAGLLDDEGYPTDLAADGHHGLHLGLTRAYGVIIVDRGLPAVDGLDVTRRLRRRGVDARILVLTALGEPTDRVDGLDAGADDYLVKPFDVAELLARVRALLRRRYDDVQLLPLGGAELDLAARSVQLPGGGRVELSAREFALLRTLAERPGAVHARERLRTAVFGDATSESIVDTYVHYLRRKLGAGVVRTVHGHGYRMGAL